MAKRQAVKRWRNGPEDKATTRITWYALEDGSDIRLVLEDACGRNTADIFPATKEEAERVFNLFRMFSPSLSSDLSSLGVIDRVKEYLARNPSTEPVEADENASSIAANVSSALTLGIVPIPGPDEPSDTLGASIEKGTALVKTTLCRKCFGVTGNTTDKRLYPCECAESLKHPAGARGYRLSLDPHADQMSYLANRLQDPNLRDDEQDYLKNRLARLHTPLAKITEENDGTSN